MPAPGPFPAPPFRRPRPAISRGHATSRRRIYAGVSVDWIPRLSSAICRAGRMVLVAGSVSVAAANPVEVEPPVPPTIHFGFSRKMFREVNENDARAALRAYAAMIACDLRLAAEPNPALFEGAGEMTAALRRAEVDVITGPSADVLALSAEFITGPFLITTSGNTAGVEYLLLTHVDGGIASLADLRHRRMTVLDSVRGSLADHWLEVLFEADGLGAPRQFLDDLKLVSKPSLAVLPVFFRQVDACVTTREGFAVAVEMNPQLGRQLRVLATSSVMVPVVTCFRRGFDPGVRKRIVDSLASLQNGAPGRQLLTIFQSGQVEACDDDALTTTRELLADYARHMGTPAPQTGPIKESAP